MRIFFAVLLFCLLVVETAVAEKYFNCDGVWQNQPCKGAPASETKSFQRESESNTLVGRRARILKKRREEVAKLQKKKKKLVAEFDRYLASEENKELLITTGTEPVGDYCKNEGVSAEKCKTAIDEVVKRMEEKKVEVREKAAKEKEERERNPGNLFDRADEIVSPTWF